MDARLRAGAEEAARRLGISLSQLVSDALVGHLAVFGEKPPRRQDPVFRRRVVAGGPKDGSTNLDRYLYERE